jgi:hypothetical protein
VLNCVPDVFVFLQYTLSHILVKVIVSHIVYVVHVFQSVLVSNVTTVGLQFFVSCTVLQAVFAVKHRYGGSTGVAGRTLVVPTYTSITFHFLVIQVVHHRRLSLEGELQSHVIVINVPLL